MQLIRAVYMPMCTCMPVNKDVSNQTVVESTEAVELNQGAEGLIGGAGCSLMKVMLAPVTS